MLRISSKKKHTLTSLMAEETIIIPADRWNPAGVRDDVEFIGGGLTLADMVLGFFEDGEGSTESCSSARARTRDGADEDEEEEDSSSRAERKAFWESQHQILKVNSHPRARKFFFFFLGPSLVYFFIFYFFHMST